MLECQYKHTLGGMKDRQIEPFMIAATKLSAKLTYKRTHNFPRGSLQLIDFDINFEKLEILYDIEKET